MLLWHRNLNPQLCLVRVLPGENYSLVVEQEATREMASSSCAIVRAPDEITSALAGPFFDSHSRLILDSPEIPLLRFLE
jgi:hypothetical protein